MKNDRKKGRKKRPKRETKIYRTREETLFNKKNTNPIRISDSVPRSVTNTYMREEL